VCVFSFKINCLNHTWNRMSTFYIKRGRMTETVFCVKVISYLTDGKVKTKLLMYDILT